MRIMEAGKRIPEDASMAFESSARIDVNRCAHLFRDTGQGNVFGVEDAVFKLEIVHG